MTVSGFGALPPEVSAARRLADRAIRSLVVENLGGELVTWSPKGAGDELWRQQVPAPLDGIRAARLLTVQIQRARTEFVQRARAAGVSWDRLADPLGIDRKEESSNAAIAAFELIVPEPLTWGHDRTLVWTCDACGRSVRDFGPETGPSDAERGHAEDCRRHLADVDDERRAWADEEDGDE